MSDALARQVSLPTNTAEPRPADAYQDERTMSAAQVTWISLGLAAVTVAAVLLG